MPKRYVKPVFSLGQLIRTHASRIAQSPDFTSHQKRMLMALGACRTSALGAHKVACTECGQIQIAYNSCRNRNCPNCQARQRQNWVQARAEELLPVPYFHLVFTLPDALNPLCLHHPRVMYRLLFEAAWYTVQKLGKDPKWIGAQPGMVAILHTWGSNLSLHPHLHCMVPAGGLKVDGQWKHSKSKGKYLFNREVMGNLFRARYVKLLRKAIKTEHLPQADVPNGLFRRLFAKPWMPYAEQPFKKAQQVINYIGRYSHSIAIGNHRIKNIAGDMVTFSYKNYRKNGKKEDMQLDQWEFLHRFARHIVPHRFIRIRHYGILSNRSKKQALLAARGALDAEDSSAPESTKTDFNPLLPKHYCTCCGTTTTHLLIEVLPPARAGPLAETLRKLGQYRW